MGVATICIQTVIYVSGCDSRNKQGYAMTCGTWLTKEAGLCYNVSNTSTFSLASGVRPEYSVKRYLDDPTLLLNKLYLLTYILLYSSPRVDTNSTSRTRVRNSFVHLATTCIWRFQCLKTKKKKRK